MPDPGPATDLDPAPVLAAVARDPLLRVFLGHGRIETVPAKYSRRRLLLDQIAQAFEPGVRYPEDQVSMFLGALHPDYAVLRRCLVDEEFLTRSAGLYWRSGGTVPTHQRTDNLRACPTVSGRTRTRRGTGATEAGGVR